MCYADQSIRNFVDQVNPVGAVSTGTAWVPSISNKWTHVRANNRPVKGGSGTYYEAEYQAGATNARDYTALAGNADATTLWVRCGVLADGASAPSGSTNVAGNYTVLELRNSSFKIVARLVSLIVNDASRSFYWEVLDATTQQVLVSKLVATISTSSYPADSDYNQAIDFRILLDTVGGYVQAYNTAGQLIAETLGTTCTAEPRAYISLGYPRSFSSGISGYSLCYTIVSTTTTFGMLAIPLLAKSAGTKNDALAGDYTQFQQWYTIATIPTPLKLEAAVGETKQVDFKFNSLSDIGMPANYRLDAVMLRALNTAISADGTTVPAKITMSLDGVTFFDTAAPVVPNIELAGGKYQTKSVLYNTNPVTASAWQPSDIANLYVGMKLER